MSYERSKDVIPFIGSDEEVDIVLFITDGNGEPKKVNVRRCIDGDETFSGNATLYSSNSQEMRDFLLACSRVPLEPIQFAFDTETDALQNPLESSFKGTNGMQFCYQLVYNDGFVSAISPFSEVAYPSVVEAMGVNTLSSLQIENVCNLLIPNASATYGPSEEVRRIKLFFREGNEGVLKFIDEVSLTVDQSEKNWDVENGIYSFRNDEVYGVVSNDILNKNSDYLPRKAKTQTVSDDRLMYGGYTEGFEDVVTSSTTFVRFNERITRLIGSELEIKLSTTLGDGTRGAYTNGDISNPNSNNQKKQIHSGFRLDMTGMELGEEGVYDLRVNVAPEKNFHIFSSQPFFGQGFAYFNSQDGTTLPSGIIDSNAFSTNGYSGGGNAPKSDQLSATSPVSNTVLPVTGNPNNRGVLKWDAQWNEYEGNGSNHNEAAAFAAGTSPTNPIILKGSLISFRVAFQLNGNLSQNLFMDLLNEIIMTGGYSGGIGGLDVGDVQIFESPSSGSAPVFDQIVDLGLESGESFDSDDDLADLICHVTSANGSIDNPVGHNNLANIVGGYANFPLAYYIVNRAKVQFQLAPMEKDDTGTTLGSGSNPLYSDASSSAENDKILNYKFKLKNIVFPTGNEFDGNPFSGQKPEGYFSSGAQFGNILTCIPQPVEGLGVQSIRATSNDGDVIGLPYQGDDTGSDASMGNGWRKGEIDFDAIVRGDTNWPGLTGGAEEDYYTDPDNWTYNSLSLMPFCIGRRESEGGFEYRWPIAKTVSGGNVPNSNIAHPSINGLGVKKENGDYLSFKSFGGDSSAYINQYGRIQGGDGPVAIGKWFVFDGPGLNEWYESFSYPVNIQLKRTTNHNDEFYNQVDENGNFSGAYTFRASHPATWLPFPFAETSDAGDTSSFGDWSNGKKMQGYGQYWISKFLSFEFLEDKDPDGTYTFSVVDGAAGPGGKSIKRYSDEVVNSYSPGDTVGAEASGISIPVSNTKGAVTNKTLIGISDNMPYLSVEKKYMLSTDDDFEDTDLKAGSFSDVGNVVSIITDSTSLEGSFKSNDVHNFGIVYYDERGRCSSVYRLGSTFVPGYSNSERTANQKGSVDIEINLQHPMPSWAKSYEIVYSGSSNTRRFIQFIAGGAFTETGAIGTQDDKIYVSLNYLQGSGISYTKAFGARDQDTGEPILYRFSEGDQLRIISSFVDDEDVVYHPSNYVFDIVGVEEISQLQDNPLLSDDEDYGEVLRRTGSFVVLRNNLQASGFDAQKVALGTSKWGNRTLVEIVTPRREQDEDRVPYFETGVKGGKTTPVGLEGDHSPNQVIVTSGDVFFRAVPSNIREFSGGSFVDLIQAKDNKDEDNSSSRFRGIYMESPSVSDLFRSNAKNFGRAHYVMETPTENFNEASIIYGEKNVAESFRPTITSFPSPANFLDLPKRFGGLDYMYDTGASITALQETKVSEIQVNKAITTTAGASGENLALSKNVLNDPRFYKADLGSSKRPDSVLVVDNDVFFIDADKKILGRVTPRGIEILTDGKTSKLFDKFFEDVTVGPATLDSKYSLGYNPRTQELLLTKYTNTPGLTGIDPFNTYGRIIPEGEVYTAYEEGDNFFGLNEDNPQYKRDIWPWSPPTISYSLKGGYWKTFYSTGSKRYEYVDNTFVSIFPGDESGYSMIWRHNDESSRNQFYGEKYASYFNSFVNDNPTTSHIYTNVSIDGSSQWNLVLSTENELTPVTNFVKKEDTFYSEIPKTELQGGTSHVKTLGVVESVENLSSSTIKFKVKLTKDASGYTFNVGTATSLFFQNSGEISPLGVAAGNAGGLLGVNFYLSEISGNEVTVESDVFSVAAFNSSFETIRQELEGKVVFVRSIPRFFGDPLRGKYLKLEAVKAPSEDELISINISATPSNLDSSM